MSERYKLLRVVFVGVLMVMVVKGLAWMLDWHPDATAGTWTVQVVTVGICAVTAWVTWRPPQRLEQKLSGTMRRTVPYGQRATSTRSK